MESRSDPILKLSSWSTKVGLKVCETNPTKVTGGSFFFFGSTLDGNNCQKKRAPDRPA